MQEKVTFSERGYPASHFDQTTVPAQLDVSTLSFAHHSWCCGKYSWLQSSTPLSFNLYYTRDVQKFLISVQLKQLFETTCKQMQSSVQVWYVSTYFLLRVLPFSAEIKRGLLARAFKVVPIQ